MHEQTDHRQGIGRRLAARAGVAMLVLTTFGAATGAQADGRSTSLSVSATVLPSCLVSTEPQSGASPATVACSNFGSGSIAVERDRTASESSRVSRPAPPDRESARADAASYVTITY